MSFTLILGNKAYSSWSLRPWIAMKQAGIPFEERVIPIYMDGSSEAIRKYSPAGKVPILKDGNFAIWDSLSIIEYLAEKHPTLWPADFSGASSEMIRRIDARISSIEGSGWFWSLMGLPRLQSRVARTCLPGRKP